MPTTSAPPVAIDDLFALDSPSGSKPNTVNLPAVVGFGHGLWEFVVSNFDSCLSTLLLGEDCVQKLVGKNLILPVTLRDFGKVRQCATVQFYAFLDQFPANPGNHLLAPSIKQPWKCHPTSCGCTTELAVAFYDQSFCAGTPGLNGRDMACCTTADYEYIHGLSDFRFASISERLCSHVRIGSNRHARDGGTEHGLVQKSSAIVAVAVVIGGIRQFVPFR